MAIGRRLAGLDKPGVAQQDMEDMGVTAVDETGEPVSNNLDIHHDNIPAAELFARCATCWNVGMDGSRLGLRYADVLAVMEMMGQPRTNPDLLDALSTMEQAALGARLEFPELEGIHILRVEPLSDDDYGEQL